MRTLARRVRADDAATKNLAKPAALARVAALSLLLFGWAGVGNAAVPTKEIWFYNDSGETVYVVLISGARKTDEWLQALEAVPPDQRPTRTWTTKKDYRIYVNGKDGVPPGGFFKIRIPFFTLLKPFSEAQQGTGEDVTIDWWNGGRLAVYDEFGADDFKKDYDADNAAGNLIVPGRNDVPPVGGDQQVVTCLEGDCKNAERKDALNMFGGVGGLPDNDPSQLTEFTFGDAITADKSKPYVFFPQNVNYNISSVDQVYLPLAMEPLHNKFIPYIGSVLPFDKFRELETKWLGANPGWPVYKGFPDTHPRIPEAHIVFLDGLNPDGTYNGNGPLTHPGTAVANVQNLYLACMGPNPPKTADCTRIQDVMNGLFIPNFENYVKVCNDASFKNTTIEQLRHLYGWVAYNSANCPDPNPLFATPVNGTPITNQRFEAIHEEYLALEYNYRTEAKADWFNPYVELIHGPKFLDMAVYAFSTDDRLGFVNFRGDGLIYALGSDKHLPNKDQMDKKKLVTVGLGDPKPTNAPPWASVGICSTAADDLTLQSGQLSFDFFPPLNTSASNPCMVTIADQTGRLYQFNLTQPGPTPEFRCDGVSNFAWCNASNVNGHTINTPPPNPAP